MEKGKQKRDRVWEGEAGKGTLEERTEGKEGRECWGEKGEKSREDWREGKGERREMIGEREMEERRKVITEEREREEKEEGKGRLGRKKGRKGRKGMGGGQVRASSNYLRNVLSGGDSVANLTPHLTTQRSSSLPTPPFTPAPITPLPSPIHPLAPLTPPETGRRYG